MLITLQINYPLHCPHTTCLPPHCQLCVAGSDEALGSWSSSSPLLMRDDGNGVWKIEFTPQHPEKNIEYKYVFYHSEHKTIVAYEQGNNRVLEAGNLPVFCNDEQPQLQFEHPRMAGVAIPVFSLRSQRGFGTGEFADIPQLVDWALQSGLKMIQVLPINDTTATHTWDDSYPYSAISVFALHPLYLNLQVFEKDFSAVQQKEFLADKENLNQTSFVDYPKVMQLKWKYIEIAYQKQGKKTLGSADFKAWFEKNTWLCAYAAYCYLRQKFGVPDFSQWENYAACSAEKIAELTASGSGHYDKIALHYFVQYHLHLQLRDAAQYARSQGIILKGDIPIGVSRHSCDAWVAPQLYNMEVQAGAPPDAFSTTGQNWGFPTYRWDKMSEDNYQWWQQRLQSMSSYFDAFRIDHILGFFRIWEIPFHSVQGLLGYFAPALPLSVEELNARGVWFDHDRLCKPYIPKNLLFEQFGDRADKIENTFFAAAVRAGFTPALPSENTALPPENTALPPENTALPSENTALPPENTGEGRRKGVPYPENAHPSEHLQFKTAYNTQRKIETYFAQQKSPDTELKDFLFSLCNEVVLIEDKYQPAHYHPRIAMADSRSYRALDEQQKNALNAIYNDFFYHRHNDFWREQAMKKLPAIRFATQMLVCGEDLGMVPQSVPYVMQKLNILSLIIQRMPCSSQMEFADLQNAPYASVCSPGSHDTSGIRTWWEEDRNVTQRYFQQILQQSGEAPPHCEPWLATQIIRLHLQSPAMWAVFPLQDLLATDDKLRHSHPHEERINQPSDPKNKWKYRMHISLEELLAQEAFNKSLKGEIREAGRI